MASLRGAQPPCRAVSGRCRTSTRVRAAGCLRVGFRTPSPVLYWSAATVLHSDSPEPQRARLHVDPGQEGSQGRRLAVFDRRSISPRAWEPGCVSRLENEARWLVADGFGSKPRRPVGSAFRGQDLPPRRTSPCHAAVAYRASGAPLVGRHVLGLRDLAASLQAQSPLRTAGARDVGLAALAGASSPLGSRHHVLPPCPGTGPVRGLSPCPAREVLEGTGLGLTAARPVWPGGVRLGI
jgi:hypothetical protein